MDIILFNPHDNHIFDIIIPEEIGVQEAEEFVQKSSSPRVAKLVFKSIWSDPKPGLHLNSTRFKRHR